MDKVACDVEHTGLNLLPEKHPIEFRHVYPVTGLRLLRLSSTDLPQMSSTSPKPAPQTGWKTARSVILCGASVRSLAESAIAAGFHPLCVDFFEDEDLKNLLGSGRGRFVGRINSFQQIPQVIRSVRKSIPLLWAGGLENHTNLLRDISSTRAVIGPDLECVDQLRNPWKLYDWLTKAGIDVPRLATDATAESDCHWLRKSVTSSGGLGVGNKVAAGPTDAALNAGTAQTDVHVMVAPLRDETIDKAEVPAAQWFAQSGVQLRDVYLQEYIDGVPMSATLCADESGLHLFGMCLQLTGWPCLGASDFLFCGNVGPVDPGEAVMRKVVAIARVLIECSGLRGVFGLDFILRQGKVWLLEVNPRLTASHMLFELQQPGLLVHRHLAALGWKSSRPRRSLEASDSRLLSDNYGALRAATLGLRIRVSIP